MNFSKHVKYLIVLFLVCLIAVYPLFQSGFHLGHDGELHLGRITAYARALSQGQFPVRWSDQLEYGYGSPIFIVTYPLPYLLGALIYQTGIGLVLSFKILIALGIIGGLIGVYFAALGWQKNHWLALAVAVIYTMAPYHLVNSFLRVAIGEMFLLTWPGWWLWAFFNYVHNRQKIWLVGMTLLGSLIILSHQLLGGLTLIVLVSLALTANQLKFKIPNFKLIATLMISCVVALLISAWYWLPAYKESAYTMLKPMLFTKPVTEYLLQPWQVFYQPWTTDWHFVPAMLGIPLSLIWIWLGYQTLRRRLPVWPWLTATAFMFFCLNLTMVVWQKIELLHYFQTPWRLMNFAVMALSFGALFLAKTRRARLFVILIAVFMLIDGVIKLQVLRPEKIDETYYATYPKSTAWHWEGTPIWTAGDATAYASAAAQLVGNGQVVSWQKSGVVQKGEVQTVGGGRLVVNTFYFPGWQVWVNRQPTPIEFQDMNYRGLITFNLPDGKSQVELKFTRTKTRILAEVIGLAGLGLIVIFWLLPKKLQTKLLI